MLWNGKKTAMNQEELVLGSSVNQEEYLKKLKIPYPTLIILSNLQKGNKEIFEFFISFLWKAYSEEKNCVNGIGF